MEKRPGLLLWLHLRTGLVAKLFIPIALFNAVVIVLVALLAYEGLKREITLQYDQRARGAASLLSYEIEQENLLENPLLLTQNIQQLGSFYSDFYRISVFAPSGASFQVIASSDPQFLGVEAEPGDLELMRTGIAHIHERTEEGRGNLEIRYPLFASLSRGGQPIAFLSAYTSLVERDYKLGALLNWIVIIAVVAFVMLPALLFLILQITTFAPLRGLVEAAKRVNRGDLETQAPYSWNGALPDEKVHFELPIVVRAFNAMIQEIRIDREKLHELSIKDPLTGFFNRRHFDEIIPPVVEESVRTAQPFAVLMLTVNGMHDANSRYGHRAGDQLLRLATEFLHGNLKESDLVFRWGGAEIMIFLPSTSAAQASERLKSLQADLIRWNHGAPNARERLNLSVGLASAAPGQDLELVLRKAGDSMYEAKANQTQ